MKAYSSSEGFNFTAWTSGNLREEYGLPFQNQAPEETLDT